MTGFCTSARFLEHDTGAGHPERPDRLRAISKAVAAAALPLVDLAPTPADDDAILAIHSQSYINHIQEACENGLHLDADTPTCPASFEVAHLAVGALLTCCDAVVEGKVKNAFAAVRPPGHHAEPARAMGFCLFANVAIAARYLQRRHGVGKIAIVDFDVHHGNGTQAAFEGEASVLFISLHQDPATCYPGTGYAEETGIGKGRGFTVNIPLQPGTADAESLDLFDARVLPKLDEFKPEFLLISAGFDAHRLDPLAQLDLTEDGFAQITRRLVSAAGGRVVSALEGGYCLDALAGSVVAHLTELSR